jgi:hypothetical protein
MFINVNNRNCAAVLFVVKLFVQNVVKCQEGFFENLRISPFFRNVLAQVVEEMK